jgi:hypothetical protein
LDKLYTGITNGIPNENDNGGNCDALNANLAKGGMIGHETDINT